MVFVKTLEIFGFILEICKLESFDLDIFEQIQKISIHCGFNNEKIISDPIIVKKNDGSIELFEAESIPKMKESRYVIKDCKGFYENIPLVDQFFKKKIKRILGTRSFIYAINTIFKDDYNMESQIRQLSQIIVLDKLSEFALRNKITTLTSYLDLTENSYKYTLTKYHNNITVVNLGLKQCGEGNLNLLKVIDNQYFECSSSSLSVLYDNPKTNTNSTQQFSREPIEAIAILIDTSGSMDENYLATDKSRILVAKDFFNSFANRTLGYNLHHIVSLTTFDSSIKIISDFTENILKFCKVLESVTAGGNTSL